MIVTESAPIEQLSFGQMLSGSNGGVPVADTDRRIKGFPTGAKILKLLFLRH
jgi:hypothetical protein